MVMNVGIMEIGIVMATMIVDLKEWRKKRRITAVNTIPRMMFDMVSSIDLCVTDASSAVM